MIKHTVPNGIETEIGNNLVRGQTVVIHYEETLVAVRRALRELQDPPVQFESKRSLPQQSSHFDLSLPLFAFRNVAYARTIDYSKIIGCSRRISSAQGSLT